MSSGFRLVGGKTSGEIFSDNELLSNPVTGLMMGVLATVLVQSSSTSTSIVVTMVASEIITVRNAIPIIMGANIGTSLTNTIVSLAHSSERNEFRRAFGGATVHDMFNWLSVVILLPLEATTGYLYCLTEWLTRNINFSTQQGVNREFLTVITKPFTKLVIQLDKKVITEIALGIPGAADKSLIKTYCKYEKAMEWVNRSGDSNLTEYTPQLVEVKKGINDSCCFLFYNTGMNDAVVGIVLLALSLVMLCSCLILMVKVLHSLLRGQIAVVIKKTINSDFPGVSFLTGYFAILVGAGMTMLVQSSSVFTSAMTPLVGIGVISLDRMFPLTLGANIGTTVTGILAALASSGRSFQSAIQIALCHLFFNISGILIFYPIPPMRKVPIGLAKMLGNTTAKYRWFAILYVLVMFVILPGGIFCLSWAGPIVLLAVSVPLTTLLLFIVIVNVLQRKAPNLLPVSLRTWDALPLWMHSLQPLDSLIGKLVCCACCRRLTTQSGPKVELPRRDMSTRALLSAGSSANSSATSSRASSQYPSRTSSHVNLPYNLSATRLGVKLETISSL